jgi:hypothetical protein
MAIIKSAGEMLQHPPQQAKKDHVSMTQCRRRELNPHEHKAHCALNAARLPIPPLRRVKLFYLMYDLLSTSIRCEAPIIGISTTMRFSNK